MNMEFTTHEAKVIERLRKRQRQWPITRWLVLLNAVLLSCFCWAAMTLAIHQFREISSLSDSLLSNIRSLPPERVGKQLVDFLPIWRYQVLAVAVFIPVWIYFSVMTAWHFVIVMSNWRGHAVQMILLKLLDAQQNHTATRDS